MEQPPGGVRYAQPGGGADAFQRSRATPVSVEATVAWMRAAIESVGLWVLHEINPQALLRRGGYDIPPTRQLLFFHPRYVAGMLATDPAALLEAPLKIAVMESPDGAVTVRWLDPIVAFGRYGNPELGAIGQELAAICETIVAAAAA